MAIIEIDRIHFGQLILDFKFGQPATYLTGEYKEKKPEEKGFHHSGRIPLY